MEMFEIIIAVTTLILTTVAFYTATPIVQEIWADFLENTLYPAIED